MKPSKQNGRRYILHGHIPVPCKNPLVWARWMEGNTANRIVRQEYVGPYWVSTVFLGLSLPDHPAGLFQTMIFRDATDDDHREWTRRGWDSNCPEHLQLENTPVYDASTWRLALKHHAAAVGWVRDWFS